MPRTLLRRTCQPQADYFQLEETYYDPARRLANLSPLVREGRNSPTCSVFFLDENTLVDSYCTVVGRDGKKRSVYGTGTADELVRYVDEDSNECSGLSDLRVVSAYATNTSALEENDGKLTITVSSSVPPLTVYVVGAGSQTVPSDYATFEFTDLKKGTYAAFAQDGNNNRVNVDPLTIAAGDAPGTSGFPGANVGQPITWAKYEYVDNAQTGGGAGSLAGLAWNKATKQGYAIERIQLQYPEFYQYTPQYLIGDVVRYTRKGEPYSAYFQALKNLYGYNYQDNNRKLPYPDQNGENEGYWKRLPLSVPEFRADLKSYVNNKFVDYGLVEEGAMTRWGWDGFYKARQKLDSRSFANNLLPKPDYGKTNQYWELVPDYSIFNYVIPETEAIDEYFIGTIYRRVYFHLFNPDLPYSEENRDRFYFVDVDTKAEAAAGDLRIIDIIKHDIDAAGQQNGSAWILADSPSLPLRFHLQNGVRPGYPQDNTTGQYENLHAGLFRVDVYDAQNRHVVAEFEIQDEYRPRWRLLYDDAGGTELETLILERGWAGGVTDVLGQGQPVVLSWDSGSDKAGYVPESVGATLEFSLLTQVAQQFVDTILQDDRNHRVDHYRQQQLQFRGYIDATSYEEKLLGPGQTVSLIATDGLGALGNTFFLNHQREPQVGRTSLLSTLLSCLSRTDVNLPLICGVNLRDQLMAADGDPLELAYGQRTAYGQADEKPGGDDQGVDCRTVLNAILRNFNAFLYQKDGGWHLVGLNEVMDEYEFRTWSPAGVLLPNAQPTSLRPLRILASADATAARELYWLNAGQRRTTVAAAALVTATVTQQLEENLLKNGDFAQFLDKRPLHWSLAGGLVVSEGKGEKAGEKAVKFTKYAGIVQNGSYLLSSGAPHLPGQDEDWMRVTVKAKLEDADNVPGDTEVTAKVLLQVVCDGQPFGPVTEWEISSKDKWKEFTQDLYGLPGTQVRVRLLAPIAVTGNSQLLVSSVALKIQPAAQQWPETAQCSVLNPVPDTGIKLDDVELVHADLPRLPGANGVALEPVKMDAYAWRHGLTLQDYTATSAWKRPSYPGYTPLLEVAAQDRLLLRAFPTDEITGEVKGPGFDDLGVGTMLDLPGDGVDGRFMVISCFKRERERVAQVTLRKLAPGSYGQPESLMPANARIANRRGRKNYRVVWLNGVKCYRVANR